MILSVHAIFGAAVASQFPNHPVLGFTLGFASHFILDAIPHKDYELISLEKDLISRKPKFMDDVVAKFRLIRDVILVSFDALVGLCLAYLFFFNPTHPFLFLLGAVASLLPDFITFLYIFLKHKSLILFTDLHVNFIHTKYILKLNQVNGVFIQFCTIGFLIAIMIGVNNFLFY
jgi:hypothetical protein